MKATASKNSGFTLIELLVVILIIGILVVLAYPSYVAYVHKSHRGEAQQLLLAWAVNQEIWRSSNPEYATTEQLAAPTHTRYTFSLPSRSATMFVLRASAGGDQINDQTRNAATCSTLEVSAAGVKSPAACWE